MDYDFSSLYLIDTNYNKIIANNVPKSLGEMKYLLVTMDIDRIKKIIGFIVYILGLDEGKYSDWFRIKDKKILLYELYKDSSLLPQLIVILSPIITHIFNIHFQTEKPKIVKRSKEVEVLKNITNTYVREKGKMVQPIEKTYKLIDYKTPYSFFASNDPFDEFIYIYIPSFMFKDKKVIIQNPYIPIGSGRYNQIMDMFANDPNRDNGNYELLYDTSLILNYILSTIPSFNPFFFEKNILTYEDRD